MSTYMRAIGSLPSLKYIDKMPRVIFFIFSISICINFFPNEVQCSWLQDASNYMAKPANMVKKSPIIQNPVSTSIVRGVGKINDKIVTREAGKSNGFFAKDNSKDYQAACLIKRKPSWRENPSLYYFSSERHSPETYGCSKDIKFDLNVTAAENPYNSHEFLDGSPRDRANITRDLLQPGLYDGNRTTYILVHGFLASWNSDTWMCRVKDMILNSTKANVFIVDWSGGSQPVLPIDYGASVTNTQYVGQMIGDFVSMLMNRTDQTVAKKYHLIGHSLGAHISGYVGYSVGTIGRITALDPAGPCFTLFAGPNDQSKKEIASRSGFLDSGTRRLSPESADIVMALHTDTSLFGLSENCAHFDIYVNGGVEQPECTSLNPADRLQSLLNLDLAETFDFNIACSHSYAHNLLDSIVPAVGNTLLGTNGHSEKGSAFDNLGYVCIPMAYKCSSWDAFKSGECGYCKDDDSRCVYTGIDLSEGDERQLIEQTISMQFDETEPLNGTIVNDDDDDDDTFNDEDEDEDSTSQYSAISKMTKLPQDTYNRHFIRAGSNSPTCLYHYQIVVVSKASEQSKHGRRYHYLQLPLTSDIHDVDRVRTIQVSHQIPSDSEAYKFFGDEYIKVVRHLNQLDPSLTTSNDDIHLEFYTALVTFEQLGHDQCKSDSTPKNVGNNKWGLCDPIPKLSLAYMWAADESQLKNIQWVGVNHMSGISDQVRKNTSHLFVINPEDKVYARDEVETSSQPSVEDVTEPISPLTNPIGTLVKPIDCLVSNLDNSETGKSKSNLKCGRSKSEMKYMIKLLSRKNK